MDDPPKKKKVNSEAALATKRVSNQQSGQSTESSTINLSPAAQSKANRASASAIGQGSSSPTTTLAELQALQNPPQAKIRPETQKRGWSGSLTQAEHDARQKMLQARVGPIKTAPSPASDQWAKGGKLPGGGRGGGGKLIPLPPTIGYLQRHKEYARWARKALGFEYQPNPSREREALKRARDAENKRNNNPVYLYRRKLWDLQMAEVGLTPEGRELGGVRAQMIQRMNHLRGGG